MVVREREREKEREKKRERERRDPILLQKYLGYTQYPHNQASS